MELAKNGDDDNGCDYDDNDDADDDDDDDDDDGDQSSGIIYH